MVLALVGVVVLALVGWFAVRPAVQSYITPSSWLHADANDVEYITWVQHGSAITGHWKGTGYFNDPLSGTETLLTGDSSITGSISGNTVYFNYYVRIQGITNPILTLKGILGFRTLTIPECNNLVFQPGDENAYNQAAFAIIQRHASGSNSGLGSGANSGSGCGY